MNLRQAFACLLLTTAALAQPARRAVLIDIDGVRGDTFFQAWQAGMLPHFQRAFGDALWFDNASTVIPPVTMPAQASIATGVLPARHGIPGNQWYDRQTDRLYDYMNTAGISCTYGFTIFGGSNCLTGLGNRHLLAPTMYEVASAKGLDSVVAYNQFWKGASRPAAPTADEARAFLPGNRLDFRAFDNQMAGRVLQQLQTRGLPAILTLYFTGADTIAHSHGIEAQPAYLAEVIDPLVGKVVDAIAAVDPEWRTHTLFLLTSDHGRTNTAGYPDEASLRNDLLAALPAGSHVAINGGMAYLYVDNYPPDFAATLEQSFTKAIAAVRPRSAEDPTRAGELVVTLRAGHYFGVTGKGSHHGAPTRDDLNVPLVVSMPHVSAGHSSAPVGITQIARTIADFVGFAMPDADPPLPVIREMRRK